CLNEEPTPIVGFSDVFPSLLKIRKIWVPTNVDLRGQKALRPDPAPDVQDGICREEDSRKSLEETTLRNPLDGRERPRRVARGKLSGIPGRDIQGGHLRSRCIDDREPPNGIRACGS
ncbi:MAG: hypothetical protein ACOY58_03540, partial [Candidatus Micrarchaeota archaeon]